MMSVAPRRRRSALRDSRRAHPNASFITTVEMSPFTIMPMAPTGATSEVGAKPYASRLSISPLIMPAMPTHQIG